jgi:hypothetical protein
MLVEHCSDHLNKHIKNILVTCHCCDHSIRANFRTKKISSNSVVKPKNEVPVSAAKNSMYSKCHVTSNKASSNLE